MFHYQDTARGLKMIFWSQVGSILCVVTMFIPALNVFTLVAALATSILSLVGLSQAARDDEAYQRAFVLVIINLVISFFAQDENIFSAIMSIISNILSFVIIYYICTATSKLLRSCNEQQIADKGDIIWSMSLVKIVGQIICSILLYIPFLNIIAFILLFLLVIFVVILEVMYMKFLYSSSNVLDYPKSSFY